MRRQPDTEGDENRVKRRTKRIAIRHAGESFLC